MSTAKPMTYGEAQQLAASIASKKAAEFHQRKPTTESIKAALRCALTLSENSTHATMHLHTARLLFEYDVSTPRVVAELERAREFLVTLRRTQTAALENIEAAIKSARGDA